ncbi:MAG: hypothetical protein KC910_17390, partial [Candidatus Eremiobacteraeota bacterium]|nr:hypothetical protein [Candidatus Eremiobacteraeota bacterium]
MKRLPVGVLAAVVLGLLARAMASVVCDVSVDEGFTYFLSTLPMAKLMVALKGEAHPPGMYLVTKLFSGFTHSQFWLRLPSFLAGCLAPIPIYWLGKQLEMEEESMWVGAVVALNWLTVIEEAKIRMYGMLDLCCLVALALFLASEQPWRKRLLVVAILTLPWLHLFGFGLLGLMCLLALKPDWATGWQRLALGASLVCGGLWLLVVVHTRHTVGSTDASVALMSTGQSGVVLKFPCSLVGLDALAWEAGWAANGAWSAFAWIFSLLFWAGCLVGALRLGRENLKASLLCTGFALVPPLTLALFSLWAGGRFVQQRYFVVFLPVLLLLLFKAAGPKVARPLGLALIVVNGLLVLALPVNPALHAQHWRTVTRYLEENARPQDKIVVYHPYAITAIGFYYPHQQTRFKAEDSTGGTFVFPPGA